VNLTDELEEPELENQYQLFVRRSIPRGRKVAA
jgi:hypothetical protein